MELDKKLFAIVRVRGIRSVKPKLRKTFELLMLNKPNHCVFFHMNPQLRGMLNIVRDYIAFGEVSEKALGALFVKRGTKGSAKLISLHKEGEIHSFAKDVFGDKKKVKEFANPVFRLHPPRKGWKNLKLSYPFGDLGKRPNMDVLLKSMM